MATVKENSSFGPVVAEEQAHILRKAMKGAGTNEDAIIGCLTQFNAIQRQELQVRFKTMFGRDLVKDLKSETSHNFQKTILAMMMLPMQYMATELRKAMKGGGTKEGVLVEILMTRNNEEIRELRAAYKLVTEGRDLEKDVHSETSGAFRRALISQLSGGRDEGSDVDDHKAKEEAKQLYEAGIKKAGTDESVFNRILFLRSFPQLRETFKEYEALTKKTIIDSIKKETSGNLLDAYLAVARAAINPAEFYANKLNHSMKGGGTDDATLIRIIVSRSEIDLEHIKKEFEKMYKKSLAAWVKDDTSGDYRKLLLALIK